MGFVVSTGPSLCGVKPGAKLELDTGPSRCHVCIARKQEAACPDLIGPERSEGPRLSTLHTLPARAPEA